MNSDQLIFLLGLKEIEIATLKGQVNQLLAERKARDDAESAAKQNDSEGSKNV